jgi:hypothetical protein
VHRMAFLEAMDRFLDAADIAATGHDNPWPRGLRIKRVSGTRGIWEMTWSMRNPDGRATWEWTILDGEVAVAWRRVGNHSILKRP